MLAIVGLALIPLAVLVWITSEYERSRADDEARLTAFSYVDRLVETQQNIVADADSIASALARGAVFNPANRRGCHGAVAPALAAERHVADIVVTNASGRVVCSAVARRPGTSDVHDQPFFKHAAASRGFVVGDYRIGGPGRAPLVSTALAARGRNGALRGVVAVALDMGWLPSDVRRLRMPRGAVTEVVGTRATLLGRYPDPRRYLGQRSTADLLAAMRRRARGSLTVRGLDGVERLAVFARLPTSDGTRINFVAGIPFAAVYASSDRIRRRTLIAMAIVVLAAMLLAALAAQRLVLRPIQRLAETARHLGAGDLSARAGEGYSGELAALAQTLDRSAETLERRERDRVEAEATLQRLAEQRQLLVAELLAAEDRTRTHLSEALHDDALQVLLAARHELADAEKGDRDALARARDYLEQASTRVRVLTNELAPLLPSFTSLADAIERVARLQADRNGWDLRLELDRGVRTANDAALMRAARELLQNVATHAGAHHVFVSLHRRGDGVELEVRDDGRGFGSDIAAAVRGGHIGLASLSTRVEAVGGTLTIDTAPGRGLRAAVSVPFRAADGPR